MNATKILLAIAIFLFSFIVRLWNLTDMGQTMDEKFYIEQGITYIDLYQKGDFLNPFLIHDPDMPFVSKFLYGIPGHWDLLPGASPQKPQTTYELIHARLLSVLVSSLCTVLVAIFAWEYVSLFVGIVGGIIFATLPTFVGLSQIASVESFLMLFFIVCSYLYIKLLEKPSQKKAYVLGILTGFACFVKFTNSMLLIFYLCFYVIFRFFGNVKQISHKIYLKLVPLFLFGSVHVFIFWPSFLYYWSYISVWEKRIRFTNSTPPWEYFFGRPIHLPFFYFFIELLITTPFLILLFSLFGLKRINKSKNWILYCLVAWFVIPFIQSIYPFRQEGVRYIIQIYVPLSLMAGMGIESILKKLHASKKLYVASIFIILTYCVVTLSHIAPYYFSYFNVLVGGAKNVYEKNLFETGWWGEGGTEIDKYFENHITTHATVGLAYSGLLKTSTKVTYYVYSPQETYDYVVVNIKKVQKDNFDENVLTSKYKLVYSVLADGAQIVHIYQKK